MSTPMLQARLAQIAAKIRQAEAEKEGCIDRYYENLAKKLKQVEAHGLPPDVLVGAVLDAIQKYQLKDKVIEKWEGMAHPFFRPKRSKPQAPVSRSASAPSTDATASTTATSE